MITEGIIRSHLAIRKIRIEEPPGVEQTPQILHITITNIATVIGSKTLPYCQYCPLVFKTLLASVHPLDCESERPEYFLVKKCALFCQVQALSSLRIKLKKLNSYSEHFPPKILIISMLDTFG